MHDGIENILIVAEAGVNHNGDLRLAHRLVDEAADAGADIVKFQIFHAEAVISACAPKAAYQMETTGGGESQLDMVRKLELPVDAFTELKDHCEQRGIRFWSTAFDLHSVDFLREQGLTLWKIPSGEITNLPYLRKIGAYGQDVVLSTGMATLGDVEIALDILESAGTSRQNVILLHCTTDYPTPIEDVNLRAMEALRAAFPGIRGVGYSDHTQGIVVSLAATALGAMLIEKHFTLDRAMSGPDHAASLEPAELADMIREIRNISVALGDGRKWPTATELKNRIVARKSLVAAVPIKKGEVLSERNMTVKRPGSGISALHWDKYLGRSAERDYKADELI